MLFHLIFFFACLAKNNFFDSLNKQCYKRNIIYKYKKKRYSKNVDVDD